MRPKHRTRPGATYFATTSTWQKQQIFQRETLAQILEATIFRYRDAGNYLVHAYVIMPDHIHVILTPGGSTSLEKAMQLVKGGSSRQIGIESGRKFLVWQQGFSEHQIRDNRDYEAHVRYIRENPVKAKLCERADEYAFNSASSRYRFDAKSWLQGLKPIVTSGGNGGAQTPPLHSAISDLTGKPATEGKE